MVSKKKKSVQPQFRRSTRYKERTWQTQRNMNSPEEESKGKNWQEERNVQKLTTACLHKGRGAETGGRKK